ncbi:MAG TPA: hypothetical protein VJH91_01375 [Candidatus Paceibacterota bacterium]
MIKETEVNAKDEVTGSIPVVGSRSDPACTGVEPEEGSVAPHYQHIRNCA